MCKNNLVLACKCMELIGSRLELFACDLAYSLGNLNIKSLRGIESGSYCSSAESKLLKRLESDGKKLLVSFK